MKIYLVRHGESEVNAGNTSQRGKSNSPLTARGCAQAEEVAKRCTQLPIEAILASTMNRAQETAQIISNKLGKGFETFPFLVERRRASGMVGKASDDPEFLEIQQAIENNFTTPGWRHSDEENFDDLKARALQIIDFLATRPEQNILVIAHGYILKIISEVRVGNVCSADSAFDFTVE